MQLLDFDRDSRHVRAAIPSDRDDLSALYDRRSRGITGSCTRDSVRWTYLMEHVRKKLVYKRDGSFGRRW